MPIKFWSCLVWVACAICSARQALALGWVFESGPPVQSVFLNSVEYNQLKINAGWANDDPQTMMFEVKNPLPGAVFCPAVQFTEKSGKSLTKELRPKLYLPTGSMRRANVSPAEKEKIKSYVLVCTCNKPEQGPAICTGN